MANPPSIPDRVLSPSARYMTMSSLSGGDPEMQLLLCCAHRELGSADRERLDTILRSGPDWERLAALTRRHRMLPLAWQHLQLEGVPPATAAWFGHAFVMNAGAMLHLSGELLQIVQLFKQHGIVAVPYKGPALGAHLYGNVALRQAGDLDILVKRDDVMRARALLIERGYAPRHDLTRGGAGFMRQSRYSEEFHRKNGLQVELHWAFTNGDIALPLDLEALEPRLATMKLGGHEVPVFDREDLLLILCVHGCKHRWDHLEWICGVAELLRTSAGVLDWDALVRRSSSLGIRRMLLLGVLVAHELLDAPVPPSILALARADRAVFSLAAEVPTLLVNESVTGGSAAGLSTDIFRFRLRERHRDRIRFLWYRATTPSRPESWSAVAVGRRWLPLHGVLRPFRVMGRILPAFLQHRSAARRRVRDHVPPTTTSPSSVTEAPWERSESST